MEAAAESTADELEMRREQDREDRRELDREDRREQDREDRREQDKDNGMELDKGDRRELDRKDEKGQEAEEEVASMELQEGKYSRLGLERDNDGSQARVDRSGGGGSREGLGDRSGGVSREELEDGDSPEGGRTGETRAPETRDSAGVSDLARERKSPPGVSIEIEF